MAKIKMTGKGYELFTGPFGTHEFVNGVSVEDVSTRDAERLGAVIPIETVDGVEMNVASSIQKKREANDQQVKQDAVVVEETESEEEVEEVEESLDEDWIEKSVSTSAFMFNEAQLVLIADEEGIEGLRKLSEPVGLKSNSITGLLKKMLAHKG
jgi:hypothetical protein